MTDDEWIEYVKWWKRQWCMSSPDRSSVEQYLRWQKEVNGENSAG